MLQITMIAFRDYETNQNSSTWPDLTALQKFRQNACTIFLFFVKMSFFEQNYIDLMFVNRIVFWKQVQYNLRETRDTIWSTKGQLTKHLR